MPFVDLGASVDRETWLGAIVAFALNDFSTDIILLLLEKSADHAVLSF
jgi:hypothetical protein